MQEASDKLNRMLEAMYVLYAYTIGQSIICVSIKVLNRVKDFKHKLLFKSVIVEIINRIINLRYVYQILSYERYGLITKCTLAVFKIFYLCAVNV